MKSIVYLLVLLASTSMAQTDTTFLKSFALESELKTANELEQYKDFDFSNLWMHTENQFVYGIIGDEHQRIKMKLLSIKQNPNQKAEYSLTGKSCVKSNVCDFIGKITIKEIKEFKTFHYGVDAVYADKGIKAQGILMASYEFMEDSTQYHSGLFKGQLYTRWYLDKNNRMQYDNIEMVSDGYMNNAFIGFWINYSNGAKRMCHWGDYRVPMPNKDFDTGAGEFAPSQSYLDKGWQDYKHAKHQKAWWD